MSSSEDDGVRSKRRKGMLAPKSNSSDEEESEQSMKLKVNELNRVIRKLREEINEKDDDIEEKENCIEKLKKRIGDLKKNLKRKDDDSDFEYVDVDEEKLKAEIQERIAMFENIKSELCKRDEENEHLQNHLNDLEKNNTKLENEVVKLQQQEGNYVEEINKLESELQTCKLQSKENEMQVKRHLADVNKAKDELDDWKRKFENIQMVNADLQRRMNENANKFLESSNSRGTKDQVEKLKKKLAEKEDIIRSQEESIEKYKESAFSVGQSQTPEYLLKMLAEKEEKITDLKQRIKDFKEQVAGNKSDASTDRSADSKLRNYQNDLRKFSDVANCRIDNMDDCIKAYKKAAVRKGGVEMMGSGDWRMKLLDKDREIEDLSDKISALETQLKKSEKKFKREMSTKQEEIEELQEELESAIKKPKENKKDKKQLKEIEEKLQEKESENEGLIKDIANKDKVLKEKIRIIESLESDITRLKDEQRKSQISIGQLEELVTRFRVENTESLNEKNQALEKVGHLQKQCELKQQAIETMKTKLESKNAEAIVEANELHKALQVEKDKCQELTALYNSHKEKCNNYETKIRNLEADLHKMHRQNFQQRQQENANAQFGDNRADDKEPEWWNRHKRQGATGGGNNTMPVCPNCRTMVPENVFNQHVMNCVP